MSENFNAKLLIKDVLVSVGFAEDVDMYANLFMMRVNDLAFDMYMKGLPQTAADLVLTEVMSRTRDEQKSQFITELLSRGENQHFLREAAQQVAGEFLAKVKRET